MSKPVAWSYTALTAFETCPKQFYHTRVAKDVPNPPGEAALWGQRVHKGLEDRVRDKKPLPPSLEGYEGLASKFDNAPGSVIVEKQICIDRNMQPTEWFSKTAWCRGVIDVGVLNGPKAAAWDWKTGKRKPDNQQLQLFAGLMFIQYPEVEVVNTGFIWLQEKKMDKEVFMREQTFDIWETFMPRVARLEKAHRDNDWQAKPSGLCNGWCSVKACPHWKPKR